MEKTDYLKKDLQPALDSSSAMEGTTTGTEKRKTHKRQAAIDIRPNRNKFARTLSSHAPQNGIITEELADDFAKSGLWSKKPTQQDQDMFPKSGLWGKKATQHIQVNRREPFHSVTDRESLQSVNLEAKLDDYNVKTDDSDDIGSALLPKSFISAAESEKECDPSMNRPLDSRLPVFHLPLRPAKNAMSGRCQSDVHTAPSKSRMPIQTASRAVVSQINHDIPIHTTKQYCNAATQTDPDVTRPQLTLIAPVTIVDIEPTFPSFPTFTSPVPRPNIEPEVNAEDGNKIQSSDTPGSIFHD